MAHRSSNRGLEARLALEDVDTYRMLRPGTPTAGPQAPLDFVELLASSPRTDPATLDELADDRRKGVRRLVAENPATPDDTLGRMLAAATTSGDVDMLYALATTIAPSAILPQLPLTEDTRQAQRQASAVCRYLVRRGTPEEVRFAVTHGSDETIYWIVDASVRGALCVEPAELASISADICADVLKCACAPGQSPFPLSLEPALIEYCRRGGSVTYGAIRTFVPADVIDAFLNANEPELTLAVAQLAARSKQASVLNDAQLGCVLDRVTPHVARALMKYSLRSRLTSAQLWTALRAQPKLAPDTATEILHERSETMPEDVLVFLLQCAGDDTQAAWLHGKLPAKPTPHTVALLVAADESAAEVVATAVTDGALQLSANDFAKLGGAARAMIVDQALDDRTRPFPAALTDSLTAAVKQGAVTLGGRGAQQWLTSAVITALLSSGEEQMIHVVAASASDVKTRTRLSARQLDQLVDAADTAVAEQLLAGAVADDLTAAHLEKLVELATAVPNSDAFVNRLTGAENEQLLIAVLARSSYPTRDAWLLGQLKPQPTAALVERLVAAWRQVRGTSLMAKRPVLLAGSTPLTEALAAVLQSNLSDTVAAVRRDMGTLAKPWAAPAAHRNVAAAYLLTRLRERYGNDRGAWLRAIALADTLKTGSVDDWLTVADDLARVPGS